MSSFLSSSLGRLEVKRMVFPSGDHRGLEAFSFPWVNCTGRFFFRSRSQMWVSYLSSPMFTSE